MASFAVTMCLRESCSTKNFSFTRFFPFFFFSHPKRVNLFPFSCNGRTTDDGKMNLAILILTLGITPKR